MNPAASHVGTRGEVLGLIYELLDAHADTLQLFSEPADELRWEAHLDYLRALQRRSREILAGWYASARGSDWA